MKVVLFFILSALLSLPVAAQSLRLTIGGGFANYSGDIQQKWVTTSGSKAMISAGVALSLGNHFVLRSDLSYGSLAGDDKRNGNISLVNRNLNFKTSLTDLSLVAEYHILSLEKNKFTPYIFGGIGVFAFNPYSRDSAGNKVFLQPLSTEGQGIPQYPGRNPYKLIEPNIPYGAGLKLAFTDKINIGAELALRKLFTDYVDDVSKTYADRDLLLQYKGPQSVQYAYRGDELAHNNSGYPVAGTVRGNSANMDSYYFVQLRIEVKLGRIGNDGNIAGRNFGTRKYFSCPF